MPGPPVARIISTEGCFISAFESSIEGTSIQPIISSGAPAAIAASRTNFAAAIVDFFALGCGEKIIAFLVFNAKRDLKMAVDVGFVVGMIPAITPNGSATVFIPLVILTTWTSSGNSEICDSVTVYVGADTFSSHTNFPKLTDSSLHITFTSLNSLISPAL